MAPTNDDLRVAIAAYWKGKSDQRAAAEAISSTAEGTSKAVRGGAHFAPVVSLLARFFTDAGYPESSIGVGQRDGRTILPGYYRPTKAWDLVVVHKNVLVAAIELKALGGPSFGNNYNNRVEEALGNAVDLSRAGLASLTGGEPPWLGYFFIMDDAPGSQRPGGETKDAAFPPEDIWHGRSYQERFSLTGQRLLDERLYDAVCYLVSSADDPGPREPAPPLDWRHFSAALQARLKYLGELGYP
jgi:Restriction endonuclease XhoI